MVFLVLCSERNPKLSKCLVELLHVFFTKCASALTILCALVWDMFHALWKYHVLLFVLLSPSFHAGAARTSGPGSKSCVFLPNPSAVVCFDSLRWFHTYLAFSALQVGAGADGVGQKGEKVTFPVGRLLLVICRYFGWGCEVHKSYLLGAQTRRYFKYACALDEQDAIWIKLHLLEEG